MAKEKKLNDTNDYGYDIHEYPQWASFHIGNEKQMEMSGEETVNLCAQTMQAVTTIFRI